MRIGPTIINNEENIFNNKNDGKVLQDVIYNLVIDSKKKEIKN